MTARPFDGLPGDRPPVTIVPRTPTPGRVPAPIAPSIVGLGSDRSPYSAPSSGRVLIVSNRLPLTAVGDENGVRLQRSSGGLATGLRGIHETSRGLWIGWSGLCAGTDPEVARDVARQLDDAGAVPVHLSADEVSRYYGRFSNEVLWPVLHDRPPHASPADDWAVYRTVNQRFADEVVRQMRPGDRVWVHDYHLMLVPATVRARRPDARIGFFLHTPFPQPESLASLPHADALLEGLLGADVVGFHTKDYLRSFIAAVQELLPHPTRTDRVEVQGRVVSAFACPMGVDVAAFQSLADEPGVATAARRIRGDGHRDEHHAGHHPLFVGIDRLDYTKGIPERLLAYERLLERRRRVSDERPRLIQVAVPSREDVGGYREVRREVETLVDRINDRFGRPGWTPVEYLYGSVDPGTLVALYRAADVMLVTPLRDGMNLVAKEFVASRVDEDGVLVLSTRAGAATELRAALLVDPEDVNGMADVYEAALAMTGAERRVRMRRLRLAVRTNDVFRWATLFMNALGERDGRVLA